MFHATNIKEVWAGAGGSETIAGDGTAVLRLGDTTITGQGPSLEAALDDAYHKLEQALRLHWEVPTWG